MHELSLLVSVVDVASRACAEAGGVAVERVSLRVGTLSGVDPEALESAWPLAIAGSAVEGGELLIERVAAAVWCDSCAAEVEIDEFFALRCPVCGSATASLRRGREFEVVHVDVTVPPDPRHD